MNLNRLNSGKNLIKTLVNTGKMTPLGQQPVPNPKKPNPHNSQSIKR